MPAPRPGVLRTATARRCVLTSAISQRKPSSWGKYCAVLAVNGAVSGTLLDGIHSRTFLQVYDVLPFSAHGLYSSWLVPPLLATFYVVLGVLQTLTDAALPSPATEAAYARTSVPYVLLNAGVLAAILGLSATLYEANVPYPSIFVGLGLLAVANWKAFDATPQGAALCVLCALGAPASEVVLNNVFGLWHYSRPDLPGMVSWVIWCYFSYVPAVGNLARLLSQRV